MQCIVMASALNSKLHWKIFMWLYKVIVDVVVIYYYHGVIILNRSNNSVFLYLKIY